MDKTLLVVLQNAWGVEDGYVPSYDRESFTKSYTGIRLKEALPEGYTVKIINSNPAVGDTADSCFPPQPEYVLDWVNKIRPDAILACGKVAEKTIKQLTIDIPIVYMPHPAYRALSKQITSTAKRKLEEL